MKILVAGDPASIHATRFVGLLKEIGHDVRVFACEMYYGQDEHLRETTLYVDHPMAPPGKGNKIVSCKPFKGTYQPWFAIFYRLYSRLSGDPYSAGGYLKRQSALLITIRHWRPDILFSLKMQNEGYLVAAAKTSAVPGEFPPWIHFCWGTDIEFFGKHPDYADDHLPRIRQVLSECDFLLTDCRRDSHQAVNFGFHGVSLGDCIAPGGFDLSLLASLSSQKAFSRDVIVVKGREGGLVGRALNVVSALKLVAPILKGFRIRFVMATESIRQPVAELADKYGLDCQIESRLPYTELLRLYGQARFTVSASDVDGTPSFLLESIAMGALPIHSDMESVREWVDDGQNGLLFPVNDIDVLAACISRAVSDNSLIENAQIINRSITEERIDRDKIRSHVRIFLDEIISGRA